MDKETLTAYEKVQRRENAARILRNRLALGRISQAEYDAGIADIDQKFQLTEKERLAFDLYNRIQEEKQRRRSSK